MDAINCNSCLQDMPPSLFHVNAARKSGRSSICKNCYNALQRRKRKQTSNQATKRYEKTRRGFVMRLYRNMKSRVSGVQKIKHHLYAEKSLLDKESFYAWAMQSIEFHALYDKYEASAYSMKLAPSVDRINSSLGYELQNMQWVTHSENSRRGSISRNSASRPQPDDTKGFKWTQ